MTAIRQPVPRRFHSSSPPLTYDELSTVTLALVPRCRHPRARPTTPLRLVLVSFQATTPARTSSRTPWLAHATDWIVEVRQGLVPVRRLNVPRGRERARLMRPRSRTVRGTDAKNPFERRSSLRASFRPSCLCPPPRTPTEATAEQRAAHDLHQQHSSPPPPPRARASRLARSRPQRGAHPLSAFAIQPGSMAASTAAHPARQARALVRAGGPSRTRRSRPLTTRGEGLSLEP